MERTSRAGSIIKRGVAAVAAGVLALSCAAGVSAPKAYATDTLSTYYSLPTKAVELQHTATGNGKEYTYEYVSIGSSSTSRVAPMAQTYYEITGLNYVNAYRGPDSIFTGDRTQTSTTADMEVNTNYTGGTSGAYTSRNASLAIMVAANSNPDEYMYNYCAWANGADVSYDLMALDHGNSQTAGTGAVSVTIDGTPYADFPRAVYMECNLINTSEAATEGATTYGDKSYTEWIALENQRANRPKEGTYDPYYAKYSAASGGAATMVAGLHTLATTIDSIVAQSVNADGNYTLQSRYGGNKADGTGEFVDKYEDVVQATQYYTMSKIEDGTVDKAVTAVLVGYDPATGNYACRKYNVSSSQSYDKGQIVDTAQSDPDTNYYGGRVANYASQISTSITEMGLEEQQATNNAVEAAFVAWYSPEQIVANADAVFVCDAPSGNGISEYLATAGDGQRYVVYCPPGVGQEEEDRTADLVSARTAAVAAGTPAANFCFSYPANMFNNFYAQGVENGMLGLITSAFTYPSIFGSNGLTDMFGYWAKNIWHIETNSVQSIVTSTTSGMSLYGTSVGTLSTNYEANAETYFAEGNRFYIAHQTEIDAINNGNLKTYSLTELQGRTSNAPAFNGGASLSKVTATAISPAKRTPAVVEKKANTMTAKANTVTANAKKKTTIKAAKAFTVKNAKGKVTYTQTSGNAKITVGSGGKVTVKKGLKANKTYKVKVTIKAAGNSNYKAKSTPVTLKVKVS